MPSCSLARVGRRAPAWAWCAFAAALLAGGAGCADTGEGDGLEPPPEVSVPYVPADCEYPGEPYGIEKGDVIGNIDFETGLVNALAAPNAPATEISLCDFYNPTRDEVYPAGSAFPVGEPKPRVLVVAMAARWCQPCRIEAKETLPEKHAELAPKGAEFLLVLADGAEAGVRATEKDLRVWTGAFDTAYPAVIDAGSDLAQHFSAEQYPSNMIIDTATMEIVQRVNGAPAKDSGFWKTVANMADL